MIGRKGARASLTAGYATTIGLSPYRHDIRPRPRPIDAPPIRLTIINTHRRPASNVRTPRRSESPIDAAGLTMAVRRCATDGLIAFDGRSRQLLTVAGGKTPNEALGMRLGMRNCSG